MKRLLGGGRMKWTHLVAKFGIAGFAVVALGFLGALFVAQTAQAAPAVSAKWLNRMYIVDNNGQNYFDSNTYDDNYSYAEQNAADGCPDQIVFVYQSQVGGGDPLRNINFFYDQDGPNSLMNMPNQFWRVELWASSKYTGGSGGESCGSPQSGGSGFTATQIPVGDPGARRYTFYRSESDKIISFKSNITFSRKGDFKGANRYFRDDEVASTNNTCPDMILLHAANINTEAEAIFGRGEIAGSAMLYAIRKDSNLGRTAESYDRASEPNAIGRGDCQVEADALNGRGGGHYGVAGYSDNQADAYFLAGGLQDNGAPATGGDEDDDAIIIFVGSAANVPKDASGAPITNPGNPDNGGDKVDEQVCKGGAMGWIICPIMSGIQAAINLLRDTMQYFLTVNPLPVGTGSLYTAWDNIRNVANIAFVLAFFIIIFSQATSIGISNYGIKRLLPRLVLIAVAANLSYFVCSFLIDLFNVLGVGITNLFAIANGGSAGTVNVSNEAGALFTGGIAVGLTWALATGNIVQIFPLIAAAFIGFVITFILLVVRQALIILLVVASPIAFIAGLLPGTQNWFRQWFEMFLTLLGMYPIVMAIFAAARMATQILTSLGG
jgi:hypothetical protein